MKLSELQAKGAFIDTTPVRKAVTWTNPDGEELTFDIRVRRLSMGSYERLMLPDENQRSRSARLLSETLVLGDGEDAERITYDQAYQLEPTLAEAFLTAINEVVARPAKKP